MAEITRQLRTMEASASSPEVDAAPLCPAEKTPSQHRSTVSYASQALWAPYIFQRPSVNHALTQLSTQLQLFCIHKWSRILVKARRFLNIVTSSSSAKRNILKKSQRLSINKESHCCVRHQVLSKYSTLSKLSMIVQNFRLNAALSA